MSKFILSNLKMALYNRVMGRANIPGPRTIFLASKPLLGADILPIEDPGFKASPGAFAIHPSELDKWLKKMPEQGNDSLTEPRKAAVHADVDTPMPVGVEAGSAEADQLITDLGLVDAPSFNEFSDIPMAEPMGFAPEPISFEPPSLGDSFGFTQ